jgi:hypothetical protein
MATEVGADHIFTSGGGDNGMGGGWLAVLLIALLGRGGGLFGGENGGVRNTVDYDSRFVQLSDQANFISQSNQALQESYATQEAIRDEADKICDLKTEVLKGDWGISSSVDKLGFALEGKIDRVLYDLTKQGYEGQLREKDNTAAILKAVESEGHKTRVQAAQYEERRKDERIHALELEASQLKQNALLEAFYERKNPPVVRAEPVYGNQPIFRAAPEQACGGVNNGLW